MIRVAATAVGNIIRLAASAAVVAHQLQRADALRRVTSDIGSRLDLDEILARVMDHARGPLLRGSRGGLPDRGGWSAAHGRLARPVAGAGSTPCRPSRASTLGTRGHQRPPADVRDPLRGRPSRRAISARRSSRRASTPSASHRCSTATARMRSASSASITTGRTRGPRTSSKRWRALATQAAVAIKAAANYAQLATWAAQLQSIQALGVAAQSADQREGDRHRDRDGAARADRLPQRPRVPAGTATTSSRWPCRARSASTSTRRRSS